MTTLHRLTLVGALTLVMGVLWAAGFAGAAGATVDYLSVSFVDKDHGWVAGIDDDAGRTRVWRTKDGGRKWAKAGSSVVAGAGVGWVSFVSEQTGVWGMGSIMHTTDAGRTWQPAQMVELGIPNDASFADEMLGWTACSYGTSESGGSIGVSTDGGLTWTRQFDLPGPDGSGSFTRVSSPTQKRCYVLKWGREAGVWMTDDGGEGWKRSELPAIPGASAGYRDIDFPAAQTGWAVGDGGAIVKTEDGGATWAPQTSGVRARLFAVDFVTAGVGYAVGGGGCLLRTVDGGDTWVKLDPRTEKRLTAVCFVSAKRGWVVGSNGVRLRTVNGGKTWSGTR